MVCLFIEQKMVWLLSSRNARLSEDERNEGATLIYKTLVKG